ncbi:MAG TPA: TVP38/TMEM64 family protein [Stenomitos sp.]
MASLPDLEQIRAGVHALGPLAPAAMVGLMVVQQLVPVIPGGLLLALSGILFGVPMGFALTMLGTLGSSFACYMVGRGPARAVVHRFAGELRMRGIEARLANRGVPSVIALRAFPFFPSYVISYGAGIVGVPLRTYLIGSVIGCAPGNFLHVLLGDRLMHPTDPWFWAAMGGLLLLSGLAYGLERLTRYRSMGKDDVDAG